MSDLYPHLAKKTTAYLEKADAERIAYIRSPRWLSYPGADDAIKCLEDLLTEPLKHRMPNLLIIGDTNNGKTMLVKRFCNQHKPQDNPQGDASIIPVLYMQAPPVPDENRFYNAILELLFAPYKSADRPDKKQFQVIKLLKAVGLKMLIIDEIHHILAGVMTKQRAFLNVIKYLGNELQIPIVGVGTQDAFRAIQTDLQLSNRFDRVILPRWSNDDEFLNLLCTFEMAIPLKNPSNFADEPAVVDLIYSMSEGYLGEASRIMVAASIYAIDSGIEKIDKKVLGKIGWVNPSNRRKEPRS
jgi:GTPase SAR1 family protein